MRLFGMGLLREIILLLGDRNKLRMDTADPQNRSEVV